MFFCRITVSDLWINRCFVSNLFNESGELIHKSRLSQQFTELILLTLIMFDSWTNCSEHKKSICSKSVSQTQWTFSLSCLNYLLMNLTELVSLTLWTVSFRSVWINHVEKLTESVRTATQQLTYWTEKQLFWKCPIKMNPLYFCQEIQFTHTHLWPLY